jgi:Domain of unknown function (DUF1906)
MICGTFTAARVPPDQLADVMQGYRDNIPAPLRVTSEADGDGTFTVTAVFPPCSTDTTHDPIGALPAKPPAVAPGGGAPPAAGGGAGAPGGVAPGGGSPASVTWKGFDAPFDCSHILSKAKTAGINFICRYYSHTAAKNLSPAEASLISKNGISLVSVWESAGDHYNFFSFTQGLADAAAASHMAHTIGQPVNSTIYFAVDMDASQDEIDKNISAYFKGVTQGFAAAMPDTQRFAIGVYGSGLTCSSLVTSGLAERTWLACSSGWRGSKAFAAWNIKQSLPADPWGLGKQVDPDSAKGAYGGFVVATGDP